MWNTQEETQEKQKKNKNQKICEVRENPFEVPTWKLMKIML